MSLIDRLVLRYRSAVKLFVEACESTLKHMRHKGLFLFWVTNLSIQILSGCLLILSFPAGLWYRLRLNDLVSSGTPNDTREVSEAINWQREGF